MLKRTIEILKAQCEFHDPKFLMITALGGEPTMFPEILERIWDETEKEIAPMGIRLTYTVYTNGNFILQPVDDRMEKILQKCNTIFFNIRHLPMDEVARRLEVLSKYPKAVRITAVMDDFNMERIEEITKLCLETGSKPYFSPLSGVTHDPGYQWKLLIAWNRFLDLIEEERNGMWQHRFYLDAIFHHVAPQWDKDKSYSLCGKQMIFDPDGLVRNCPRDPDAVVGHMMDHRFTSESYRKRPQKYSATLNRHDTPEDCKVCEVRQQCQTDCPYERRITGKSPMCNIWREIIPRAKSLSEPGPIWVTFRSFYATSNDI
jgi:radical SAM protein with 4Fe4S-binding SPASM domain